MGHMFTFLVIMAIALPLLIDGGLCTHQKLQGMPRKLPLQLELIHRNALRSPIRQEQSSSEEEIMEILTFDEMRMKAFQESVNSARDRIMQASALSASSDQKNNHRPTAAIHTGISSGASLPGHVGQYFVELSVGTPGQRFLFIVDTGSDLVWVPCSLRDHHANHAFLPKHSSTFKSIPCTSPQCQLIPPSLGATCSKRTPTPCTYEYVYTDSSDSKGIFAFDTLTMGSAEIKNVALGCGMNNSGPSLTGVGGVIGMGQGPISFSSQVAKEYGGKFSYCFKSFFDQRSTSSSTLVLGHEMQGATKLTNPIQYTPFERNPMANTFYFVGIEAVKIGGKVLPIPQSAWEIDRNGNGGTIVDSGTTLSYFMQPAFEIIVDAFKAAISYPRAPPTAGLDLCYNVSSADHFPALSIVFRGNAVLQPPSENYFLSPTEGVRCLGLLGSPQGSVLGNLMQQNYYIEYDRLSNRLGFAEAEC